MKKTNFTILFTIIALLQCFSLFANNIQISNITLAEKDMINHYRMVQFNLSWENSWRIATAPFNYDAAWVFVKYRVRTQSGGDGIWKHARLGNTGHSAGSGTAATIEPGLMTPGAAWSATSNPALGLFVYRSAAGSGTFSITNAQIRWNYGDNGLDDNAAVEIMVEAIEMVYVPQESFFAGDGTTTDLSGQFTAHNTTGNFQITGELVPATLGGTTAGNLGNNNMAGVAFTDDFNNTVTRPLPVAYPKGYNAFYCMKYEISQQQYVDFLNSLTQTQATERKFNKPAPNNYRYEITGSEVGSYTTTTPYVACNYLNWDDFAAYLDWSGLRPMSELEYEKASRGTGAAVANEYAWGSVALTQNTGITNGGLINETSTNNGNCTYGSHASVQGPMRVGTFAGASTTRVQSGASYYGIMDLSGNLKERTMTLGGVDGRMFTGLHGNGTLSVDGTADVENWLSDGTGFRGGDWSSATTLARVSARSEANNTDFMRGNNYGGRGVRTQPLPQLTTLEITSITHDSATSGGNVTSDAGSIITARGVCWSTTTVPTIALATKTIDGSGTGTFTSMISGLTENTLYYVRAYATNNTGTAYGNEVSFTTTTATFVCGSSITKNHLASGGVAPVDKTVTYGTVKNIPGETTKCWITRNLGASQQATIVSDDTEASAGWYWQFNRKQGYKHDGTTLTPSSTWDATNDNLSATWQAAKDPCTLELGAGWHIPTSTEWTNVDETGNWTSWNGPYGSALKLHAAGYLNEIDGAVNDRGLYGQYWSNTQYSAIYGRYLLFADWGSMMHRDQKANGFSVRCVKDLLPTLTTTDASIITATTATCGGTITDQGGSEVTARGVCWDTIANPTTALASKTNDGMGTGAYTSALTGLVPTTLYHVRAYCTNTDGTAYGEDKTFTTAAFVCGSSSLSINHTASGGVAPVDKTITYGTVTNIPGETTKCWITSNLGADHQATSVDDATEASAGWYWQFNRKQGFKHDGTTRTPNTAWVSSISETSDWTPANDPCTLELGAGWRIPTNAEWTAVDASENWTNWNGPWTSGLKMHAAGYLLRSNGSLSNRGSYGYYWSSSQYGASIGWYLYFGSENSYMNYSMKALGLSMRCVKDLLPTLTTTDASIITATTATCGGTITAQGGSEVTARGVCWGTSANPTTALASKTNDGMGTGTFTSDLTGLVPTTLYHVRAYCTNTDGTAYGEDKTFTTAAFVCGSSSLSINHTASGGVAPVDKTATYGTVTDIPGETSKCWITSNLGADNQATDINDASEASAGWYWRFNRKQGYAAYGGYDISPVWTSVGIDEDLNWDAANDPCSIELGSEWHIPTSTEWDNVIAGGGWNSAISPWNSELKLHYAGFISNSAGRLSSRGYYGDYWSSSQTSTQEASRLLFGGTHCNMIVFSKANGNSVRCLRNYYPIVETTEVSYIDRYSAYSLGNVTSNGGSAIISRGVCWSTISGPTIDLPTKTSDGTGSGPFWSKLTGLTPSTTYYCRAYATNVHGTVYGQEIIFTSHFGCGESALTVIHSTIDTVAPVDKTISYGTATNISGDTTQCWITKNLGATSQATSVDDNSEDAAGWYWQFNHKQGYKHDGAAVSPNWTITSITENSDWLPAKDPCSIELDSSWRLPTKSEWSDALNNGSWTNQNGPWDSGLKLHAAGYLNDSDGSIVNLGTHGKYWSSSQNITTDGWSLGFGDGFCETSTDFKARGFSVRCVKSLLPIVTTTAVTSITTSTAISGGHVTYTGGSYLTASGVCWSTTPGPTIALSTKTTDSTGTGSFTSAITGLTSMTTYYLRAYATNGQGTTYGAEVSFMTLLLCGTDSITVNHLISSGVAPVNKTVSYRTVTDIPGETSKCWITSNLGASHQATAVNDGSEASGGWYWTFNRKQGYKNDGTLTPAWGGDSGETDWNIANDPCNLELGSSWRIPTLSEWNNVYGAGGWTSWVGPWNSNLKIHAAGFLDNYAGRILERGESGYYWSSTQQEDKTTHGWVLILNNNGCWTLKSFKTNGFSIRCVAAF